MAGTQETQAKAQRHADPQGTAAVSAGKRDCTQLSGQAQMPGESTGLAAVKARKEETEKWL